MRNVLMMNENEKVLDINYLTTATLVKANIFFRIFGNHGM